MLEKANVSDGPPVERSIMKRAWPYALALAVVVTGCYLALVPLLRSLSPAPTASATSQLVQGTGTTTVKQTAKADVLFNSKAQKTTSKFVSALAPKTSTKKKAKKAKTPAVNNFATNPTSTSTTPRTVVKPKKPVTTPTSTTKAAASKPKGAPAVGGGSVDQTQVGGGGLATGGGDSGSSDFGQTSAVGP
jgi:hypothetical protein